MRFPQPKDISGQLDFLPKKYFFQYHQEDIGHRTAHCHTLRPRLVKWIFLFFMHSSAVMDTKVASSKFVGIRVGERGHVRR